MCVCVCGGGGEREQRRTSDLNNGIKDLLCLQLVQVGCLDIFLLSIVSFCYLPVCGRRLGID